MQDLDTWVNVTVRKSLLCLLVWLEHIVAKHVSITTTVPTNTKTTTITTTTTTTFLCITVKIYNDAKCFQCKLKLKQ